MASTLDIIIPKQANNDYRGGRVPFYGFCLLAALGLFRAVVHFLKDDSGVNSIADIVIFEGTPDPNTIIYMFSALMGMHQMIFVILMGLVLWRYRNLIPLIFAFTVLESCFGFLVQVMHPLTPEYYGDTPPGLVGAVPKLLIVVVLLVLSVRNSKAA